MKQIGIDQVKQLGSQLENLNSAIGANDNSIVELNTAVEETNNNIIELNNILGGKQDTLIAGEGIIIEDNVISISGSSKSALQVTCSYNDDVLKGVAVVVDETTITTKSNGLVTFTGLDNGTKSIVASKDGYATTTSSKLVENPFETADVEMNPITLTFSVKNAFDEPINGATVNLDKKVVTNDTTHSGTLYNAYTPESGSSVYTTDDPIKLYQSEQQMPTLTANGTMGGSSYACAASHENQPAWWAFDGDTTTGERCWWTNHGVTSVSNPCWITYYSPEAIKVSKVILENEVATPASPKTGKIQGSNDNSTWADLADINVSNNDSGYQTTIEVNAKVAYKYIRFYFTESWETGGVSIQEINIFQAVGNPSTLYSYDNIALAPLNPQPEFTIQTPELINASVVGTLTNNNGVYSGFNSSSYIQSTFIPDFTKTFDFTVKFKMINFNNSWNFLFATAASEYRGINVAVHSDGRLFVSAGDSSGWMTDAYGTTTMQADKWYWLKIIYNGTDSYQYLLSDTGAFTGEETTELQLTSTRKITSESAINFGRSYPWNDNTPFNGYIDLNGTSIIIDGVTTNFYDMQNGITINNVFYDKTPVNNLVEYKSETLSAITNSQGIAVISAITDGKYDYSVLKQLYETMYGQIIINRANETEPVMMYTAPINCYAAEAVTVDSAVKLNAGIGDSNTDYDVYASNTSQTNDLTLDGVARSSASAGEIAEVRITDYKEAEITIEVDQDNADIQFNNNNDICTVNIVADMKETHNYLAFKRTDNAIIYFKDREYPFVASDNNVNETSFTYYTYSGGVMTEHTATTQSSSSGNSTYDGTTLTIHSATVAVDGVWARDTADDQVIATEYNGATITTSGYLTTPQVIIPRNNYWRFAIEKSNDWDLMLVVGGAFTNLANLQEIVVPNNTIVDIYATKKNETPALFKSTYTNRLTITNDRIYRKVNFVLQVTNEGGANTTLTVNGISFTNTGVQQKLDVYAGQTVTYKVEKEGFTTQTGTYTVPDYPTIKEYIQSVTLVAE